MLSPAGRPPELVFPSGPYDTAVDIWSLGCVLGQMVCGHPLFPAHPGMSTISIPHLHCILTPSRPALLQGSHCHRPTAQTS